MKAIILLIVLTISHFSFSQAPIKRGIYKSLEEIRDNQPSDSLTFKIYSETKWVGGSIKGREETFFKLYINNKQAREMGNIQGFSDGTKLYVAPIKLNPSKNKSLFSETFRVNDSIRIFRSLYWVKSSISVGGATGTLNTSYTSTSDFSLNFNGSINLLTVEYLEELLERDPVLYDKFQKERSKEGLLQLYFLKLLSDGKY